MQFTKRALALFALSQAVIAQEPPSSSSSTPLETSSAAQIDPSIPFTAGVTAPFLTHGLKSRLSGPGKSSGTIRMARLSAPPRSSRPSTKTITSRRSSETPVPSHKPAPPGSAGLTTTTYVTATIINQVEVISICPTNGVVTTVIQKSSTCETYATCITIPASLCETFVSTRDNGQLTTCTTPVETWIQILPTAVTSNVQTVTASADATWISAGYNSSQPGSAGAGSNIQSTGKAGLRGASPVSSTPEATQTTYVTAGANRVTAFSIAFCLTFILFVLL